MTTLPHLTLLEGALIAVAVGVGGFYLGRAAAAHLRKAGRPPAEARLARVAISTAGFLFAAAVVLAVAGPIGFLSGLTVSAVAGILVSLSLQTTLSNVIAG